MTAMLIPSAAKISIEAENMGGATITGNWRFLPGTGASIKGLDLAPLDPSDIWFRATGATDIDIEDCQFSGTTMTANQLAQVSGTRISFRARDRDCTFTLGTGCREGWDFDGSTVKVVGNINPGNTVQMTTSEREAALRAPGVRVQIVDYGPGIDPMHLPRLTERFYRADDHRSRALGGTGLGLAIVKHIINRHRGRLRVESDLGQGATFTVILPVLENS